MIRPRTEADKPASGLSILAPPYTQFLPMAPDDQIPSRNGVDRGIAMIWHMDRQYSQECLKAVLDRPGGVSAIILLPPATELGQARSAILKVLEDGFPTGVLPFHPSPRPSELESLMRGGPHDLGRDCLDYLEWSGVSISRGTRALLERMAYLSANHGTLRKICGKLYLSRRALGRRLRSEGLPVPSHWLQVFRLVRVLKVLQGESVSAHLAARRIGYPDGFTLSNQMYRLVGVRPSVVKRRLGWEWFLEAWWHREHSCGGIQTRSSDR